MKDLNERIIVTLVDTLDHQNIGGEKFEIEKEGTYSYILDRNFDVMTIAESNFIKRRDDIFTASENKKLYYGHVLSTGLGYFVTEEEIIRD